jgi:hypothetical protein
VPAGLVTARPWPGLAQELCSEPEAKCEHVLDDLLACLQRF